VLSCDSKSFLDISEHKFVIEGRRAVLSVHALSDLAASRLLLACTGSFENSGRHYCKGSLFPAVQKVVTDSAQYMRNAAKDPEKLDGSINANNTL
jgi:hypothetical protein